MKTLSNKTTLLLADMTLFIVAAIWGGGFVAGKYALKGLGPLAILMYRFCGAAIIMGLIFNRRIRLAERGIIKYGLLLGVLQFLGLLIQLFGLQYTTPAKQSFLYAACGMGHHKSQATEKGWPGCIYRYPRYRAYQPERRSWHSDGRSCHAFICPGVFYSDCLNRQICQVLGSDCPDLLSVLLFRASIHNLRHLLWHKDRMHGPGLSLRRNISCLY